MAADVSCLITSLRRKVIGMRAGFIGAGKVGFTLGKYLAMHGIEISGYYSRTPVSAKEAAEFTQSRYYTSIEEITKDSDTLFLTVPDGAIGEIWDDMRNLPIKNKNICHCSGSIPSTVFFDAENRGAYRYSIHPLYAISSKATSYLDLGKACFTIEGSDAHLAELKALFSEMGNTVVAISPDSKALYHAAAVMVSNQIVALADMGTALLVKCGFSEAAAAEALSPLLLGNAQSVAEKGAVNALTGPIERGDAQTVSKHLQEIRKFAAESTVGQDILTAYTALSKQLIRIAQQKHPQKDYKHLEKELEQ